MGRSHSMHGRNGKCLPLFAIDGLMFGFTSEDVSCWYEPDCFKHFKHHNVKSVVTTKYFSQGVYQDFRTSLSLKELYGILKKKYMKRFAYRKGPNWSIMAMSRVPGGYKKGTQTTMP
jgi:hypothetical protein